MKEGELKGVKRKKEGEGKVGGGRRRRSRRESEGE